MLSDLKFVQGAVAKKDLVPALTHFKIVDGRITGYNGIIALSSPINLDLDIMPKADVLVKAIQACKETVSLHMTAGGRLSVKSGSFKAFVPCATEPFPELAPEGDRIPVGEDFLPTLKILSTFCAEDDSRRWARGVRLNGHSAMATNNVILVEAWMDSTFPVDINVPAPTIREMIRIGQNPEAIQVTASSMSVLYPGDRWLRSQLYSTEWPDTSKILGRHSEPEPFPDGFFEALEQLAPFVETMNRIYFDDAGISTSQDSASGASIELVGAPKGGCYNINQLLLLKGIAKKIDFTTYPGPCMFFGHKLRGAIIGMNL